MSKPPRGASAPLFRVQNEDWIVRQIDLDHVELASVKDPRMNLVASPKALASAQAVLSELARHLATEMR